jgi:hypothetical protein
VRPGDLETDSLTPTISEKSRQPRLVNQNGWSLNRLGNPKNPAANSYVPRLQILYVWIIKSDAESTRQFAQPAQELRAVEIDYKNTIP